MGDELASVSTPPSTSDDQQAEVNNIKLRLRPSIKRSRDMLRPVILKRTGTDEQPKDADDSSLDNSTASTAAASAAAWERVMRRSDIACSDMPPAPLPTCPRFVCAAFF